MSVLLETSKGDIVIDLFVEDCPVTTKNFLKLCKIKYYNNCLFHNVQRNFIAQTGDPLGTGKGGTSIYGKITRAGGAVGMASGGKGLNASQFYMTLVGELDSLDERHTVFGQVAEGLEVLDKINESFCDEEGMPFQNIRIRHTVVLDDPFDDAPEMQDLVPEGSPEPEFGQGDRLEDDWVPTADARSLDEIEEELRKAEARNRAVVLEMVGDLPDADSKPPPNMLFMCKLNPVTSEEDLEIIFSRFGTVTSCDIIRDVKTGDSLCYGFVAFDTDAACEAAYFKMNNVLIDDRRIKVDFSQSVHNLWAQFKTGGRKGSADMRKAAEQHERGAAPDGPSAGGGRGAGGLAGRGGREQQQQQQQQQQQRQQQRQVGSKRSRPEAEKQAGAGRPQHHRPTDQQGPIERQRENRGQASRQQEAVGGGDGWSSRQDAADVNGSSGGGGGRQSTRPDHETGKSEAGRHSRDGAQNMARRQGTARHSAIGMWPGRTSGTAGSDTPATVWTPRRTAGNNADRKVMLGGISPGWGGQE
ncbi:MAG: hypothetical protein WDW36_009900 [Sanguina aurantia]